MVVAVVAATGFQARRSIRALLCLEMLVSRKVRAVGPVMPSDEPLASHARVGFWHLTINFKDPFADARDRLAEPLFIS